MKVDRRKLQEVKGSYLLILPKNWAETCKLRKGSYIDVVTKDTGSLELFPEFAEEKTLRREKISWDKYVARRLARAYFDGADVIEINAQEGVSKKERDRLMSLISKLVNIEIIEETTDKIVIQNFGYKNLTIQQAFKREYLLVRSMFEDLLAKKIINLSERDGQVDKFYFLVVMMIRNYLSKGQYVSPEALELIRALDYRIAAEKIERIGDELNRIKKLSKADADFGKKVLEYFDGVVQCFTSNNFEKALELSDYYEENLRENISDEFRNITSLCKDLNDLIH